MNDTFIMTYKSRLNHNILRYSRKQIDPAHLAVIGRGGKINSTLNNQTHNVKLGRHFISSSDLETFKRRLEGLFKKIYFVICNRCNIYSGW